MIMLFHGTDTFRTLRNVQKIRTHAQTKQANIVAYDFDPSLVDHHSAKQQLQEIQAHVNTPLLLGNSQFVIIRRLGEQPKEILKTIKHFFPKHIDREGVVILFLEFQHLPKKHTLYTHLTKTFSIKEETFPQMSHEEAVSYIASLSVHTFHIELTKEATSHLLNAHSNDIFATWYGLHTLINTYPNETRIEQSYVESVFPKTNPEEKIFSLSQAIFEQNASYGLTVLHSLEQQGEEGLRVHGFLLSQIKKALLLKDLRLRNVSNTKEVGGNPKGHQILERQTKSLHLSDLQSIYNQLIDLDRNIKHGDQDVYPALREFIVHVSK